MPPEAPRFVQKDANDRSADEAKEPVKKLPLDNDLVGKPASITNRPDTSSTRPAPFVPPASQRRRW
jgi:hypothetical protein